MKTTAEKTKAKAAGNDWLALYDMHLRVVRNPLTFDDYKRKRKEWEDMLSLDDDHIPTNRKLELEQELGL